MKLLKSLLIPLGVIVATLAFLIFFAVGTQAGRGVVLCRLYANVQSKYARGEAREVLAQVLPQSGALGALDAEPPTRMQFLRVSPSLAIPLPVAAGRPPAAWQIVRSDESELSLGAAGPESNERILLSSDDAEPAAGWNAAIAEPLLGRLPSQGELFQMSYSLDLTSACDPAKSARQLTLEMLLMNLKLVGSVKILGGVLNQLPGGTTILMPRPGQQRLISASFQDATGRWLHLTYAIDDASVAVEVMRALRLAGTAEAGSAFAAEPEGWADALRLAHITGP